ncbi:hypothetical protein J3454_06400 [Erythrobacter sp. NFXS35]|uniref:hypothetical protein n=1 Tax=Erythrobacter sp. NFXS35 TaxID=2818436 RepID=UPI0032DF8F9E
MPAPKKSAPTLRLELDRDGFAATERLIAYEMVNSMLLTTIELQRVFAMRPLEYQIFTVIAMASVQRFIRQHQRDPAFLDSTPLSAEHRGSISRRRIAETLDLPLETVRRHVAHLIARGEIIETGRGLLSTGGGTLRRSSEAGVMLNMAQRFLAVANRMVQLDAARQESGSEFY